MLRQVTAGEKRQRPRVRMVLEAADAVSAASVMMSPASQAPPHNSPRKAQRYFNFRFITPYPCDAPQRLYRDRKLMPLRGERLTSALDIENDSLRASTPSQISPPSAKIRSAGIHLLNSLVLWF